MAIAYIGSAQGVATSSALDTTGANLLLAVVVGDGGQTFSDSKSNSWTALTDRIGAAGQRIRFYYCLGGTVGTGHTVTSSVGYHRVILSAFSGVASFGAENWTDDGGFTLAAINAGSLTPSSDGALLVGACCYGDSTSGFAMDGTTGYTLVQSQSGVSGTSYGGGLAYKLQGTAAAINPEFQWTGAVRTSASHVWFAANAGAPTINTQPTAQTANEPATATFTVSATTSGGTLHYQWKRADPGSGTFSNVGTDSSSYTTGATSAASDHGASYKVDVTDDNGTTTSDTVVLTVRSTTTTARPASDVSATGWTASSGSDLYAMSDEAPASDADYITSPTLGASTAPATFALAYPLNTGTWSLGVRAKTSSGTATLRLYLLNDANTVVGTSDDQAIDSSFTTYTLAVTTSGPATRARVEIVV